LCGQQKVGVEKLLVVKIAYER